MNSQIYENAEEPDKSGDALAAADRRIAEIEAQRGAIAKRRRALVEPSHKVVVANPTKMHHKITLGAVMVNAGFQASDADALAGALSTDPVVFAERFIDAAMKRRGATTAEVIADILDMDEREFAARGLFLTWQKRLALYLGDRAEWLARDEDFRLHGEWRQEEMTADQRWLIRVSCRILKIAMPGHLRRGLAADWLEARGANLSYRDFQ